MPGITVSGPIITPVIKRFASAGRIGMNLYFHNPWGPYIFGDFAKSVGDPATAYSNWYYFQYDSSGHFPTGVYTILLTSGSGTFGNVGNGTLSGLTPGAPDDSYTLTITTTTNDGIILKKLTGTPANVRMIAPGLTAAAVAYPSGSDLFHADFRSWMAPFTGGLRAMEIHHVNVNPIQNWADRPITTGYQTTDKGAAYEYSIALANKLAVPLWLCIPHRATDDYVTQLATIIKASYTGPRVYMEYTNEHWNGTFGGGEASSGIYNLNTQFDYCISQGVSQNLPGDSIWAKGSAFYVKRSLQCKALFAAVGLTGGLASLNWVIGAQTANFGPGSPAQQMLSYYDTLVTGGQPIANSLCVAPYFPDFESYSTLPDLPSKTVPFMLNMAGNFINTTLTQRLNTAAIAAQQHSLGLIGYEGGQNFAAVAEWGGNQTVKTLMINVNKSYQEAGTWAGVGNLYESMLDLWSSITSGVLMLFAGPHWWDGGGFGTGCWGTGQYIDTDKTSLVLNAKYTKIKSWIDANIGPG